MRPCLALAALVFPAYSLPTYADDRAMTPEAFVRAVYKDYGNDDKPYLLGSLASNLFAPRLLKLIRIDQDVPVGDLGKLDEDPFCDCQDDGGFRLVSIKIHRLSARRVTATAHIAIGVVPVVIILDLITGNGGWRTADVHSKDIPSLVAYLSK